MRIIAFLNELKIIHTSENNSYKRYGRIRKYWHLTRLFISAL